MRYVLGVDAGAATTLGLLASESGTIVAEARSGGASLQTHGEQQVEKVVAGIIDSLGGLHPVSALCMGLSGVERPEDEIVVRNVLKRLGYRAASRIVNNAVIALIAGAPDRAGIVMLAGMGAIAYGVDRTGHSARSGGLGPLLSDEGSSHWLGQAALRAAVRASDGRGPETALMALVFASLAVPSAFDLLPLSYEKGLSRAQIAALAGAVQKAADRGDDVAKRLLDDAAAEQIAAVRAVAARLAFDAPYPVVLTGGAFRACPSLSALFTARLGLSLARPALLEVEPATGAVKLALELLAA